MPGCGILRVQNGWEGMYCPKHPVHERYTKNGKTTLQILRQINTTVVHNECDNNDVNNEDGNDDDDANEDFMGRTRDD